MGAWEIILLIICGTAGGILGGMGMGGGTLLIPLLTIFCGISQHTAQAINLAAFVPMAGIALIIHAKKKMLAVKNILYIILPALILGGAGAWIAKGTRPELLGRLFGGFLVLLGLWMAVTDIIKIVKSKKEKKEKEEG